MSGSYNGGSTIIKPKYDKHRARYLRKRMKKHIEQLNANKPATDAEILENFEPEFTLIKADMPVYKEGYRAVEEAMGHPSPEFWVERKYDR